MSSERAEKAEYMRQLRADNSDYAERNRNKVRARGRALSRLKDKHPREFEMFFREEMAKIQARGGKT